MEVLLIFVFIIMWLTVGCYVFSLRKCRSFLYKGSSVLIKIRNFVISLTLGPLLLIFVYAIYDPINIIVPRVVPVEALSFFKLRITPWFWTTVFICLFLSLIIGASDLLVIIFC